MWKKLEISVLVTSIVWVIVPIAPSAARAQTHTYDELVTKWQADAVEFQRLADDLAAMSDDDKAAFYREHGTDERTWRQLSRHMSQWRGTAEGFAALRGQLADQLRPVEGFDLERYGAVAAALTNGKELADVLAAEGIDEAAWDTVQGGWAARMKRDRTFTLTTLYSHYYLKGLEGQYTNIAQDAANGVLPGGRVTAPEPISFARYVEIQSATTAAHQLGLEIPDVLKSEFGLSFSDWIALSNWWGVRMRTDEDRRYLMDMGRMSQEYTAQYKTKLASDG